LGVVLIARRACAAWGQLKADGNHAPHVASRSMSAWKELIEDAMQGIIYSNTHNDVGAAIANQMVPCGFDLWIT